MKIDTTFSFIFWRDWNEKLSLAEARLKTRKDLIPGLMLIERLYNVAGDSHAAGRKY